VVAVWQCGSAKVASKYLILHRTRRFFSSDGSTKSWLSSADQVIVRKNISVQQGENALFDQVRYFFFITNRTDAKAKIVGLAHQRCDQENVIEQLKNGVNAMRMPVNDLVSNWAYMVMSSLAWNMKAWYGLLVPNRERGLELMRMEFRSFLSAIILLPCQIVRTARRVIYRIMSYTRWLEDFFATFARIDSLAGP
jgi:hypothetical protein